MVNETLKRPDCNCGSSTFVSNPHATTGDVTLTLSTALLYEMCYPKDRNILSPNP
jgi:hypothetical protein